jgi:hypothetical protein
MNGEKALKKTAIYTITNKMKNRENTDDQCSVLRWRPQKVDKRMVLEYTHGLFIT